MNIDDFTISIEYTDDSDGPDLEESDPRELNLMKDYIKTFGLPRKGDFVLSYQSDDDENTESYPNRIDCTMVNMNIKHIFIFTKESGVFKD